MVNSAIILLMILEADMKIISLVDNCSQRENIGCEHGLSLYIEVGGKKILFDAGQTELFSENARRLSVDLSAVDVAILSHGHYDHAGGLKAFLGINRGAKIYLRATATLPHFNGERYIGIDPSLTECERLVFLDRDTELTEGIWLRSIDASPTVSGKMTESYGGRRLPDRFDHEQYLIIEEDGRRILISGCSHKGIIPIIEHFLPDIFIGGFHFMDMPLGEELDQMAERLSVLGCRYYTCHCTGQSQYDYLKQRMKKIDYLSAGDIVEI